jgi:hypothetical protein
MVKVSGLLSQLGTSVNAAQQPQEATNVSIGSCVDGALRSSTMFGMGTIAVGAVMCLACWCSHCSRLLALMWFARWVLIKGMGSTPVTQRRFSRLDDRPINIMPSAPPQPVTPYGVFLSL